MDGGFSSMSGERPENIPIAHSSDLQVTADWRALRADMLQRNYSCSVHTTTGKTVPNDRKTDYNFVHNILG